jgi:type IV pilus assembly protein PilN
MIRVNLLPQKKQARRGGATAETDGEGGSQLWLAVVLGALLVEVIALLFVYKTKNDQLAAVTKKNKEIQDTTEEIGRQMANHEQMKAQLKALRDREDAIQKLQAARTGPTSALLELSKMLTPGRGPTVDRDKLEQLKRDNPIAVPNANWDTRRLWLVRYEEDQRNVKLSGMARDGEDVSEFLRRLTLSEFFSEVKLLPATKAMDTTSKIELVKFEMSAKAKY